VRASVGLVLVPWLGACALPGRVKKDVDGGTGSPAGLGSTLTVRVAADTVRFVLHVTNVTDVPLTLEYATSQRQDFVVSRPDGRAVWQWSAARSFAQVLGAEVLLPGESRRYEAAWLAAGADGEYVATGWVTSRNYPVELRTVFEVPGG
jgi:Intracellular proteinase inhibitor